MTLSRRTPLRRRGGLTSRTVPLGQGTGLTRRTWRPRPVPAGSTLAGRPAAGDDVPVEARELVRARSRGVCEALVLGVCTQHASDVHHRKRRREGGHAVSNLLDLCRPCHRWAHANPALARPLGVIVSVYDDPATVPVRLLSRLTGTREDVYLDDAGGLEVRGAAAVVHLTVDGAVTGR